MYEAKLKDELDKRLREFIREEMGNRLTPNNWNWLIATLTSIFKRNEVEPKKEPEK